ncbi:integrase arm-type DNA-binding domain-containing protein [Muribacter muris]|uniref:integrase arm-type DNA-binding domain-containing protein n=1 Tax=Muribacter muris TaxID=67855 RepID=UPI00069F4031|nr:integrase arm-type DNA-binding domain-containing protein [Muribacter muris]
MARLVKQLTNTQIDKAKPKEQEYTLPDGQGMFLLVLPSGNKSWRFNYVSPITNKRTKCSLGRYPEISLAQARAKREEFRVLLAQGIDPQAEKQRKQEEAESQLKDTFYLVAKSYFGGIYQQKAKNPETREKNWARLENHIFPYIGGLHISEIKVKLLVDVYGNVADRSNTLKKLHQLITAIMDHAITKGIIESHNCHLAVKSFHLKASTLLMIMQKCARLMQ